MHLDERMEEMRRRMEERNAQMQDRMNNLMNRHGLNSPNCQTPPPVPTTPMDSQIDTNIENNYKFCPECGNKCDADAKFCMQCGTRLDANIISNVNTDTINNTEENQADCPVCFEDFEDWGFRYRYELEGEEKVIDVIFKSCSFEDANGEEVEELCWCIDGEVVDIHSDDFRGCEDIHDCGVAIAKKLNIQHDGKVMMSFGQNEETLTDVAYEICLDKNLNYLKDNRETVTLTLYANRERDIVQTMFYEIDEDVIEEVKEAFENNDCDEIQNYLESDFFCNETLDLWGDDDAERLGYEITDCDGDTIDEGEILTAEANVFKYRDIEDNFAVTMDYHPKHVVITTDSVKRAYTTFEIPANFNIGGISFIKNNNTSLNILNCEQAGDTVTGIQAIRYAGETYYCDDIGDCGTIGDIYYFLYEWDEDKGRYTLVAQC